LKHTALEEKRRNKPQRRLSQENFVSKIAVCTSSSAKQANISVKKHKTISANYIQLTSNDDAPNTEQRNKRSPLRKGTPNQLNLKNRFQSCF